MTWVSILSFPHREGRIRGVRGVSLFARILDKIREGSTFLVDFLFIGEHILEVRLMCPLFGTLVLEDDP